MLSCFDVINSFFYQTFKQIFLSIQFIIRGIWKSYICFYHGSKYFIVGIYFEWRAL